MELPKYKPEQWVVFNKTRNIHMGKIMSARFYKLPNDQVEKWHYTIVGGPDITHTAAEDEIVATFTRDRWERVGGAKSLEEAGIGI